MVNRGKLHIISNLAESTLKSGKGKGCINIIQGDLSDPKQILKLCRQLKKDLSHLDLLFLNAGVMPTEGLDLWTGCKNLLTRYYLISMHHLIVF